MEELLILHGSDLVYRANRTIRDAFYPAVLEVLAERYEQFIYETEMGKLEDCALFMVKGTTPRYSRTESYRYYVKHFFEVFNKMEYIKDDPAVFALVSRGVLSVCRCYRIQKCASTR